MAWAAARSAVQGHFAEASKRSDFPNPNGSLSPSVSPIAIKEANKAVTRERASREEVTLNSNLSSKLQLASTPPYMITKQLFGNLISKQLGVVILSAHRVLANGHVLIALPFEPAACACAVDHAKLKPQKFILKEFWSII